MGDGLLKFILFLFVLLVTSQIQAKDFKLVDGDCKTMGVIHLEKNVSIKQGSKGFSDCKLTADTLSCNWYSSGNSKKANTKYTILLNQDGYVFGKSASGNINLLVDFNSNRFNHGQINILESLSLVTKVCTGKVM